MLKRGGFPLILDSYVNTMSHYQKNPRNIASRAGIGRQGTGGATHVDELGNPPCVDAFDGGKLTEGATWPARAPCHGPGQVEYRRVVRYAQGLADAKNNCSPAGLNAAMRACPSGDVIHSISCFAPL